MGYYTINLLPCIQYTTTKITEFGKLGHNYIYMGMCASVYIFQSKLDKLLSDIEGIKTYTYDILFLSKECFHKHIDQIKIRKKEEIILH